MRLESALYSSREGLTANGQAISVVGDNISNSNTVAYKSSRVEFEPMLGGGEAGRDPDALSNVGYGVKVKQVRQIHEDGFLEPTGRALDVGIQGNGFFIVGDAANPKFSRAGNFEIDREGMLVTADGTPVLGVAPGGGALTSLNMVKLDLTGKQTTTAAVAGNLDSRSPIKTAPQVVDSFRQLNADSSYMLPSLTVYDSLGAPHNVAMSFTKTGINQWTAQAYVDGKDVGGTEGAPVKIGADMVLNFGTDGNMTPESAAAAKMALTPAWAGGAAGGAVTVDLGRFSQFATTSGFENFAQDGNGSGNIMGYEFRKGGEIFAALDSGSSVQIGTLQLANFANLDGLQRDGKGLYVATADAGTRMESAADTGGMGSIQGSSLERSTVDIANQFVDLVVYQRGYQASSQTMNAANTLLKETLQLIR